MSKQANILDAAASAAVRDAQQFASAVAITPGQKIDVSDNPPFDKAQDGYVVIKLEHKAERTAQGIVVPANGQKHQDTGIVLMSGNPEQVPVGARVLVGKVFMFQCDDKVVCVVRTPDVVLVKWPKAEDTAADTTAPSDLKKAE